MSRTGMAIGAAAMVLGLAMIDARGDVPGQIHYQGRLVRADAPVNGAVAMEFVLFDADTGGTELFREAQTVDVADGQYSVYLGATQPLAPELFRDHPTTYLEVRAAGQTLTPRDRIVAVGYAFHAAYAQEAAVARSLAPEAPAPRHIGSTTNVAFFAHMDNIGMNINSNSEYLVDWQDVEYDTAQMFDTGSDSFTAPVSGLYRLSAQATLGAGVDTKLAWLVIRWNGVTNLTLFSQRMSGTGRFSMYSSRDAYLGAGDYVEVYVNQTTSLTLPVYGGPSTTYFSGYLLQEE